MWFHLSFFSFRIAFMEHFIWLLFFVLVLVISISISSFELLFLFFWLSFGLECFCAGSTIDSPRDCFFVSLLISFLATFFFVSFRVVDFCFFDRRRCRRFNELRRVLFLFCCFFFFIFALVPRGFAAHSFRTFFSADFGTLRSEKPLKFERNVGVGWLCYRWTCTMIEPHWNQKNVEKMDRNDWNMIYN